MRKVLLGDSLGEDGEGKGKSMLGGEDQPGRGEARVRLAGAESKQTAKVGQLPAEIAAVNYRGGPAGALGNALLRLVLLAGLATVFARARSAGSASSAAEAAEELLHATTVVLKVQQCSSAAAAAAAAEKKVHKNTI
ncbi:hypothetical protein TYRP_015073 [Tyrophagus putrescentiae]|nr:hypothetical protein TYRP_015073 [Tyrophagus putrescentiae]